MAEITKSKGKMRFLYLEADAESRRMVTFMLSQSNIEVVLADTVTEAWRLANSQNFDLFLLDGLFPGGNSLNLCRKLREYAPNTPILFYSAMGFQSDIQNGLDAGANAYLVKPYEGDLSETVLNTILNAKSLISFVNHTA